MRIPLLAVGMFVNRPPRKKGHAIARPKEANMKVFGPATMGSGIVAWRGRKNFLFPSLLTNTFFGVDVMAYLGTSKARRLRRAVGFGWLVCRSLSHAERYGHERGHENGS
jgi:hypothetical protein